ncbi:hypothetical protein PROFUN_09831 [Planoprotostelium fungivorum]|uniref:Uncharacterized protein n=1 Tax=Planoprotostelium fungivorum TaxID=1890364 RepID=A0A2P6NFK1_9EUKA|nr:hypothetical protein PROFUN_09831 [Planoprotostelium fungivorum]
MEDSNHSVNGFWISLCLEFLREVSRLASLCVNNKNNPHDNMLTKIWRWFRPSHTNSNGGSTSTQAEETRSGLIRFELEKGKLNQMLRPLWFRTLHMRGAPAAILAGATLYGARGAFAPLLTQHQSSMDIRSPISSPTMFRQTKMNQSSTSPVERRVEPTVENATPPSLGVYSHWIALAPRPNPAPVRVDAQPTARANVQAPPFYALQMTERRNNTSLESWTEEVSFSSIQRSIRDELTAFNETTKTKQTKSISMLDNGRNRRDRIDIVTRALAAAANASGVSPPEPQETSTTENRTTFMSDNHAWTSLVPELDSTNVTSDYDPSTWRARLAQGSSSSSPPVDIDTNAHTDVEVEADAELTNESKTPSQIEDKHEELVVDSSMSLQLNMYYHWVSLGRVEEAISADQKLPKADQITAADVSPLVYSLFHLTLLGGRATAWTSSLGESPVTLQNRLKANGHWVVNGSEHKYGGRTPSPEAVWCSPLDQIRRLSCHLLDYPLTMRAPPTSMATAQPAGTTYHSTRLDLPLGPTISSTAHTKEPGISPPSQDYFYQILCVVLQTTMSSIRAIFHSREASGSSEHLAPTSETPNEHTSTAELSTMMTSSIPEMSVAAVIQPTVTSSDPLIDALMASTIQTCNTSTSVDTVWGSLSNELYTTASALPACETPLVQHSSISSSQTEMLTLGKLMEASAEFTGATTTPSQWETHEEPTVVDDFPSLHPKFIQITPIERDSPDDDRRRTFFPQ